MNDIYQRVHNKVKPVIKTMCHGFKMFKSDSYSTAEMLCSCKYMIIIVIRSVRAKFIVSLVIFTHKTMLLCYTCSYTSVLVYKTLLVFFVYKDIYNCYFKWSYLFSESHVYIHTHCEYV